MLGGSGDSCKPAWEYSSYSRPNEVAISCRNCFLEDQSCSFESTEWDIEGWPVILESKLGFSIRKVRGTGPTSQKVREAPPRATSTRTPRTQPTEPVQPAPPSTTGETSSLGYDGFPVQDVRIRLEDLTMYEASLSDPERTIVSLQSRATELRALRRRAEQQVEMLRIQVEMLCAQVASRGQIVDQLVQRFDRAVVRLGGAAIVDRTGANQGGGLEMAVVVATWNTSIEGSSKDLGWTVPKLQCLVVYFLQHYDCFTRSGREGAKVATKGEVGPQRGAGSGPTKGADLHSSITAPVSPSLVLLSGVW